MITLNYKLNKDILNRTASELNWKLKTLKSSIYFINQNNRIVNGKTLIGLISGNLLEGNYIKVLFDNKDEINEIRQYLSLVGEEIAEVS